MPGFNQPPDYQRTIARLTQRIEDLERTTRRRGAEGTTDTGATAYARRTAFQSISTPSTLTVISFTTGQASALWTASAPERATANRAGWYGVTVYAPWWESSSPATGIRMVGIVVNGIGGAVSALGRHGGLVTMDSKGAVRDTGASDDPLSTSHAAKWSGYLASGDYVQGVVASTVSATLGSPLKLPHMAVHWIGP